MIKAITQALPQKIPATAGIGLRSQHYVDILERQPDVGWLEVHPENYFGDGGPPLYYLSKLREIYPLSLHGVGLSIGSVDPIDTRHLTKLKSLIERFSPDLVSEHLSWGSFDGQHMNDLLPLPYTEEALDHFCGKVRQTQEFLERKILIENPSSYLSYQHSTIPEWEFFVAIAENTGCGLLFDINNVYVSAINHGFDPLIYLDKVPTTFVGEIHLAGHAVNTVENRQILIDDHGSKVCDAVWKLFEYYIAKNADIPVLIEWDSSVPELDVLLSEADRAKHIMERSRADAA